MDLSSDVRARRAAGALRAAGHSVTIVDVAHGGSAAPPMDGVELRRVRLPRWVHRHRDPVSTPLWLASKAFRTVAAAIAVSRVRAEVYYACDVAALPATWLAARIHGAPLIFDSYELPMVQSHLLRRPLVRRVAEWVLRGLIPAARVVLVVSSPIAGEIERRYRTRAVAVVRNVPEYVPPISGSNHLRTHLMLPPSTQIALYQGGFQANRGLELLVRAASHLPSDAVIALMGGGESEGDLRALVDQLGVADRVYFVPAVPYAELLSWTASADLGLLLLDPEHSLSIRLCLPNKLFEYFMAGLPVVTSELDAAAALVRQRGAGVVVEPLEPVTVARAISSLLGDQVRRAEMRARALHAAASDLRWDVEARHLVEVYNAVLERHPAL